MDKMTKAESFPAHIEIRGGETVIQPLSEHIRNTAKYAAEKLSSIGLKNTAYLAGLVHDMGKAKREYADYLEAAANGKPVARGSVNHTFCGVIYLLQRCRQGGNDDDRTLASEIIAYAVGAHHGQFDCITPDDECENGFERRLNKNKKDIGYDEAVKNFLEQCAGEDELDGLFEEACKEIKAFRIKRLKSLVQTQYCFFDGLCARLVLSAVIEGDRRDTAEFTRGSPNAYIAADEALWSRELSKLETALDGFCEPDKPINRARRIFSDQCRASADKPGGIYRVNIPTGGGKTLSTLRYALAHAEKHSKKRVIFVIPLLTVIEQNAKVISDVLADDGIITEHHSNVILPSTDSGELDRYELMTQTWETPVVITTFVQLLNTLFGGRTSEVRRMSSLCDSVIVIDEVQSLPKKLIDMFNTAMDFLAYYCNVTVLLSTATIPSFSNVKRPLIYSENPDIVAADEQLFNIFKRTKIIDKTTPYGWKLEELADFAAERIAESPSLLIVCNTKKTAKELYKLLKTRKSEDLAVYHLSTSMCMKHRQYTLAQITARLKDRESGKKVICVSTQLIEAGVDISFGCAIRVMAGLESIIQTAGRCNRNGEFDRLCEVYVVSLRSENTDLKNLPDIRDSARASKALLRKIGSDGDPASGKSIDDYYNILFGDEDVKKQFSYPLGEDKLYNLLSDNQKYTKSECRKYHLNQSFKTAGDRFSVFDEDTVDVIVPYDEIAKAAVTELSGERAKYDLKYLGELIEKVKPYTVSLFKHQYAKMFDSGLIYTDNEKHYSALTTESAYDSETGITADPTLDM